MQSDNKKMATAIWIMGIIFAALCGSPANAQKQAMRVDVPYPFIFNAKVMTAGIYSFSLNQNRLAVQGATGGPLSGLIITRMSGPGDFLQQGSLVFEKTAGMHVLSEVWAPGSDGLLVHIVPKNRGRDVVLATYLNETRAVPGKVAFNMTCGRCHGAEGKGNPTADKFFGTEIPRLSAPEIQAKTDAEIKEMILRGGRLMPPVEIDESGFRHRLPSQDVDAVIAYVRTLKR